MLTRTRAILFDVGNTLLALDFARMCRTIGREQDTHHLARGEPGMRAALDRHLAACLGECRPPGTLRFILDTLYRSAALSLSEDERQALVLENRRETFWSVLDPDAVPTLRVLRSRRLVCAALCDGDGTVESRLDRLGVGSELAFVVDSHVCGVSKPSPEIFRIALDRLGLLPCEVAYVGDLTTLDVIPAATLSMQAILYDPFGISVDVVSEIEERLQVQVHCIRRLPDLTDLTDSPSAAIACHNRS